MHTKALSYKSNHFLIFLVKISIIGCSFYFIYSKLVLQASVNFFEFINNLTSGNSFTLSSVFTLLFLSSANWILEIIKWKIVISPINTISFKTATKQTLAAFSASIFTPNRIGDYGAKALFAPNNLKYRVVILNGLCNASQMLATCFFGAIGLFLFSEEHAVNLNFKSLNQTSYLVVSMITLAILLIVKNRPPLSKWITQTKNILQSVSLKTVKRTLELSFLRYIVFSFQFYLILKLFGIDLSYFQSMIGISSMYFLASILPGIFVFDVVLKGSIAVYLFSFFKTPPTLILSTITLMWLFNTVLPSLIGYYFILTFNPLKR